MMNPQNYTSSVPSLPSVPEALLCKSKQNLTGFFFLGGGTLRGLHAGA